MSDLDDRSGGRRKGLFRRNRDEEFATPAPWAPDELDTPEAETADDDDITAGVPRRRTSADMFAQRERGWTDAWGDDAWDDEWRDPAFRRPSIPAAAAPQPAEIDAWLDDDADNWSDVTRETTMRWGGTTPAPSPAAAPPTAAAPPVAATEARASQGITAVRQSARAGATDDLVERALATVEHQSIDLTEQAPAPTPSVTAPHAARTVSIGSDPSDPSDPSVTSDPSDPSVTSVPSETLVTVDDAMDQPESALPKPRFRRTRTVRRDELDPADLPIDTPVRRPRSAIEEPATSEPDAMDPWDDATGPLAVSAPAALTEVPEVDDEPVLVPAGDARRATRREAAFSDRATWIGAMVAGLAAVRLVFAVAAGMRAADPVGASFGVFTRVGRGMADLGVTQGALLVLAVVLISLPTLMEPRASHRFDGRIAGGLGLCLGGALVGVVGALLAWNAQRHLAGLTSTGGGATSMHLFGELVATAGLCLVAFAGALRAVRSFHD